MRSRVGLIAIVLAGLSACALIGDGGTANFTQTGLASWYGKAQQGRKTASGERFDKDAMTAAHPTLAFNTVVRVTSLDNGRTVKVRINDRGPFVRGRIIDLSAAAAERLGIRQNGVGRVRIAVYKSDQHRGFDWVDASPGGVEPQLARE